MKKWIFLVGFATSTVLFQNCTAVSNLFLMPQTSSAASSQMYQNPVTDSNCADPSAFFDPEHQEFYLACTGGRFRLRTSKNMVDWEWTNRRLVNPGAVESWARQGRSWAPHIAKVNDNYIAYYTQNSSRNKGAIGASVSRDLADDNFKQALDYPLHRNDRAGGVIDPSYFKDESTGKNYLLYKIDGNSIGRNTHIAIREMGPYGLGFRGSQKIIKTGGNSLATLVEGQELVKRGKFYYLFYSHGSYLDSYKVRVSRATNIYGPYRGDRTILSAKPGGRFYGPGHGTIVSLKGRDFYFYHAYDRHSAIEGRQGMVDRIFWKDGWPTINDGHPSENDQYVPTLGVTKFPAVELRWEKSNLANPHYSFDLITAGGERVAPCISATVLRDRRSTEFDGYCFSKGRNYPIDSNSQVRVCAAAHGRWSGTFRRIECTPFKKVKSRVMNLTFK